MLSKPYDSTTKELVELAPADWVTFLGAPTPPDRAKLVDADLATVTLAADKVIRVEGAAPWLLHLEFQAAWDGSLPTRLLAYNALLQDRHRLPVSSVVILMDKGANATAITGKLKVASPTVPEWEFRYGVVKLWEVPVDRLLEGPLAIVPLAPLGKVAKKRFTELPREMDALFSTATPVERQKYWAATSMLLGLRYTKMTAEEFINSIPMDNPGVIAWQNLGRKVQAREMIVHLGEKRLGPAPETVANFLKEIRDMDRLNALIDRVLEVASWDELLAS